jgi:hypothetical protein
VNQLNASILPRTEWLAEALVLDRPSRLLKSVCNARVAADEHPAM